MMTKTPFKSAVTHFEAGFKHRAQTAGVDTARASPDYKPTRDKYDQ